MPVFNRLIKKYEWKIQDHDENYTFSICNVNDDISLEENTEWYIRSNTDNREVINDFMNTLCEALKEYNLHYKQLVKDCKDLMDMRIVKSRINRDKI